MSADGSTADPAAAPPEGGSSPAAESAFRWQAFFQRTPEPLFLLNRHRRILFVNQTWEQLTGVPAATARGLACTRARPADPTAREEVVARGLCPPGEVMRGKLGRVRRLIAAVAGGPCWWDVEFFPLRDQQGLLGILGKITPLAQPPLPELPPLPEKLVAVREGMAAHYEPGQLADHLPLMRRLADQARLAGQALVPVLLTGEAGTGKHWLARCIHYQGKLRERSCAALACARLPATALENALFGTGGLLRQAAIGTLYLHAPASLPRDLQVRLLEYLTAAEASPRLIVGFDTDPSAEIAAGRLLDPLYQALATITIQLPPLRAHLDDLEALVERFLERCSLVVERSVTVLSPAVWELLRSYSWPGNLCELYEVLLSASLHTQSGQIDVADLPAPLRLAIRLDTEPPAPVDRPLVLDQLLEQAERRLIQLALRRARGNRSRAAELLSIWRARLLRRMEALHIDEREPS